MDSRELQLNTGRRFVIDVTHHIDEFCRGRGDGLLNVFVPHATAGVALIEVGSGTESDLAKVIGELLPRDDRYRHRHGSLGHGGDHLLPAFVSPSLTLPVLGGRAQLGTWQSLVIVDPNLDNPSRRLRLSFLPG